jgi:isochorismate pyruvate lyase
MILPPEQCETMADLRGQIDRIDRALLDLLAERARCIDRAIILKPRENLPARTTDRVAQVIANVRDGAKQRDLDPELAERIWSNLIEHAIAHETKAFEQSAT